MSTEHGNFFQWTLMKPRITSCHFPPTWQNLQNVIRQVQISLPCGSSVHTFHVSLLWRVLDKVHGLKIKQNLASLNVPTFSSKPWQPHTQSLISWHSGFPATLCLQPYPPPTWIFSIQLDFTLFFSQKTKSQTIVKISKWNCLLQITASASLARQAVKMWVSTPILNIS